MNRRYFNSIRRPGMCAALIVATAVLAPASAQAGPLVSSATGCAPQPLSRTFLPWLDFANYTMAAGGSFEGATAGWNLKNGAGVVAGNETFHVHSSADSKSLSLPPGSSAVSAPTCVGLGHPTVRFFARRSGSLLSLSVLRVDVRFRDAGGVHRSLPVGVLPGGGRWQPTLPVPVVVNLLTLLPAAETEVRFAFTPVGSATWQIDDFYVDPLRRS